MSQPEYSDLQWFVDKLLELDALRFGPDAATEMLGAYGVRLSAMVARAKEIAAANRLVGGVHPDAPLVGGPDTDEAFIPRPTRPDAVSVIREWVERPDPVVKERGGWKPWNPWNR